MDKIVCTVDSCIRQLVRNRDAKPPYPAGSYSIERTCPANRRNECPYPFKRVGQSKHKQSDSKVSPVPK